jgi:hypothetical protein
MYKIKNFPNFINEAEIVTKEVGKNSTRFQFPLGKYKIEDIDPEDLTELRSVIATNILSKLKEGNKFTGATIINLIASTSTINVTPELRAQLEKEGFPRKEGDKTGNYALCQARLKTIKDLMLEILQIDPKDSKTLEKFGKVCKIIEIAKPDQGSSESYQYIESNVEYEGTAHIGIIECESPLVLKGERGDSDNNFIGYPKEGNTADIGFVASPNTKVTLNYAPGNIPDCFFYYQNENSYGLSPFIGNKISRAKTGDTYNGPINSLEATPEYKKEHPEAKDYFREGHFEDRLNDPEMKDALIAAISEEVGKYIKGKDVTGLVKSKLLNSEGRIIVIEPKDDPKAYKSIVTKSATEKIIKMIVFSPLSNTEFSIHTSCQIPNIDISTGKISGYKAYTR